MTFGYIPDWVHAIMLVMQIIISKSESTNKGGNMELLKAVNTVLPYMGEHTVTRIEGAKHPTVDLAIAAINRQKEILLSEKWWFNRITSTLPLNTDGRIDVPKDVLNVYGVDCSVTMDGEKFFNLENGSRFFDQPITVELTRDVPFERLPTYAAYHVLYLACAEVYLADFGRENTVPELQIMAANQLIKLKEEHLRQMKFNARKQTKNSLWRVKWR